MSKAALAALASIATIVGVGYTIWDSQEKNKKKDQLTPASAAAAATSTKCTIAGKAIDLYAHLPLPRLNVVVFKPNMTCDEPTATAMVDVASLHVGAVSQRSH